MAFYGFCISLSCFEVSESYYSTLPCLFYSWCLCTTWQRSRAFSLISKFGNESTFYKNKWNLWGSRIGKWYTVHRWAVFCFNSARFDIGAYSNSHLCSSSFDCHWSTRSILVRNFWFRVTKYSSPKNDFVDREYRDNERSLELFSCCCCSSSSWIKFKKFTKMD